MRYEVHPADPEIFNERKWEVREEGRYCSRFFTEEEAQDFANGMQRDYDCKEYIREELTQIIIQTPHKFMDYSQDDIRDFIEQISGGY